MFSKNKMRVRKAKAEVGGRRSEVGKAGADADKFARDLTPEHPVGEQSGCLSNVNGHADTQRRRDSRLIALDLVVASPYQPRQDFPAQEIADLAASMKAHGLIQPVCVRPVAGGHFELMEGERRVRAARELGWEAIQANVREASDDEAREIVLLAQIQRKALNAIEEAVAYRQILDAEGGPTQTVLAQRLGVTQGQISNRLRLLKLPKGIQALVISEEITATQARDLAPLAEIPAAAAAVAELFGRAAKGKSYYTVAELLGVDSSYQFWAAVQEGARDVAPEGESLGRWDQESGHYVPAFVPTAEQREQLGIVKLKIGEDEHELTGNLKLFDAMEKEHLERERAKAGKKAGGRRAEVGKSGTNPQSPIPNPSALTPEEEKARKQKLAAQRRKRIEELCTHWARGQIAARILDPTQTGQEELLELTLLAAVKTWAHRYSFGDKRRRAVPKTGHVTDRSRVFLASCFWDAKENAPHETVFAEEVREIVKFLQIDLAMAWKQDQAGTLSEPLWKTFGKDRCNKIAMAAGVNTAGMKAGQIVAAVVAAGGDVPMPPDVEAAAGLAKRGPKKKGKSGY